MKKFLHLKKFQEMMMDLNACEMMLTIYLAYKISNCTNTQFFISLLRFQRGRGRLKECIGQLFS